jgi:hypothetical protein
MKTNWRHDFFLTSAMACIVITLLSLGNSILNDRRSDSGGGLMVAVILTDSQQVLESNLRSENPGFPVERLISTPAYQKHIATLSAATKALESHDKSEDQKESVLSVLFIITTLAFLIAKRLNRKNSATEPAETPKQPE